MRGLPVLLHSPVLYLCRAPHRDLLYGTLSPFGTRREDQILYPAPGAAQPGRPASRRAGPPLRLSISSGPCSGYRAPHQRVLLSGPLFQGWLFLLACIWPAIAILGNHEQTANDGGGCVARATHAAMRRVYSAGTGEVRANALCGSRLPRPRVMPTGRDVVPVQHKTCSTLAHRTSTLVGRLVGFHEHAMTSDAWYGRLTDSFTAEITLFYQLRCVYDPGQQLGNIKTLCVL